MARFAAALCLYVGMVVGVLWAPGALAAWVFEPSAGLDFRIDDNYTIAPPTRRVLEGEAVSGVTEVGDILDNRIQRVNSARAVGELAISRESPIARVQGKLRVDGLLTDNSGEPTDSSFNQLLTLRAERERERLGMSVDLQYSIETLSRAFSSDITDAETAASDTGADVTQDRNIDREQLILTPEFSWKFSQRTTLGAKLQYRRVEHELPSVRDIIDELYGTGYELLPENVSPVPDELDDYKETSSELNLRHKLAPVTTLTASIAYKDYQARSELDPAVNVPFEELTPDPRERQLLRRPKRDSLSRTLTLRLGLDHALAPNLSVNGQIGAYQTDTDDSDLWRDTDETPQLSEEERETRRAALDNTDQGWLAALGARYNEPRTRYEARASLDVLPSDEGSQVEALDITGRVDHDYRPRLILSLLGRAYEPDRIGSKSADDRFARRFISVEPRVSWQFNRAWTLGASYQYRRQKASADISTGESNAVLFSIRYSPPSKLRELSTLD